jgi:outer membrane lipoprotein-sorting protein
MRPLHRLITFATLIAATFTAGCGVVPSLDLGHPSKVRAQADTQADAVVAEVKRSWTGLNTVSGAVSFWEKKGNEESKNKADFFWSRPGKLRANVTEADSVLKRGAKMVYLGDRKITVKVGFIKKTLPYDDPQVLSLRGYRIDQTDLVALVNGLLDPNATLRYAGSATVNGRPADLIEATGTRVLLPDLAKVQIAVDKQSHLPSQVEGFEASAVVFRAQVPNLTLNPALSNDLFAL